MSIYPVRLSEWFPPGNEMHEIGVCVVESMRCKACGRKQSFKKAWGHNSLPWGNGDLWCSEKCLDSGKTHKRDKRQNRSFYRKYGKLIAFFNKPVKIDL